MSDTLFTKVVGHSGGQSVLPPSIPSLTNAFVMRKESLEFIEKVLLGPRDGIEDTDGPRMLAITGMGGCGKTQIIVKFMKSHAGK